MLQRELRLKWSGTPWQRAVSMFDMDDREGDPHATFELPTPSGYYLDGPPFKRSLLVI
jgi:hypothetical protein